MKILIQKQIENIFSPKKENLQEEKKEKITMDYRERNCLVYSELIKLGIKVEIKELKIADYIVKDVAVERKTISDFISSMINKRLIRQLEEMQQYENKLLIVEGFDEEELYYDEGFREGGMHPNAVRGFLLSILLKYKVPIIFTKDCPDTARFIAVLAKKQGKEISLNVNKKGLTSNEQKQFILEGFSGIGPTTSKKLLAKFKTLKNIFNAPEKEIEEILGKKTEKFKKMINDEN